MAYLTKYNLAQLCQSLEVNIDISLETFLEHVYQDKALFFLLNKREIKYLFVYKMMLEDEKTFLLNFYKQVPEKEDTKKFVFNKGGKMKYHLTSECSLLKKDYLDFNIPEEIRILGEDAVNEYREWITSNNFADRYKKREMNKNSIIIAFNQKYPSKYDIKSIELNSNLLILERPNSASVELEGKFDFEYFKVEIDHLKLKWLHAFPCQTSRTFAKFSYLLKKTDKEVREKMKAVFSDAFVDNYGLDNLKNKFKIANDVKTEVIKLLLEYLKWSYNLKNKDFDNLTLEQFGLICCASCINEDKNRILLV